MHMAPPALNDGIAVGTPEQVGLQPARLQALLDRLQADPFPDLHSLLVWRRGQLVLERYFNGASRDDLHDVRSAGKSVTVAESTRLRTPLALDNYVGYGYQWWRGSELSGDQQIESRSVAEG